MFNTADYKPSPLLTIHELPHILDESVDNGENVGCGSPSLVLREPVQPLQYCLGVLLEKPFHKLDCVALSKSNVDED